MEAHYKCTKGYEMAPESAHAKSCFANGTFSQGDITCNPITCQEISILNGSYLYFYE